MISVVTLLETSLAEGEIPEMRHDRLAHIQASLSGMRRFGALALNGLAVHLPAAAAAIIDGFAFMEGYKLQGYGYEATAYMHNRSEEIVKVHRRTAEMTEEERSNNVAWRESQHSELKKYFGDMVMDQTVFIDQHPFVKNSARIVQTKMPFCYETFRLPIFRPREPHINDFNLGVLIDQRPTARDELMDFAGMSRVMYEYTGSLPDTNGPNNLIWGKPFISNAKKYDGLYLIDTIPVPNGFTDVQANILGQLNELEMALAPTAHVM